MKKTATAIVSCIAAAALAFSLVACGGSGSKQESESKDTVTEGTTSVQGATAGSNGYIETADETYTSGTWKATVTVKGYNSFVIELDAKDAPVTVSNFCNLAKNGYYDGLAFYRVVDGFCLQGGTKGNSASGNDASLSPILGEFSGNDVDNALADKFDEGTVAMARTNEMNSATSTFFVTLGENDAVGASLDGSYAAFGTIDSDGMKTVAKIVKDMAGKSADSMGVLENEKDMPVIETITIEQA